MSYFHAGGIDRPLLITKEGVESVVPRETWRGQFHAGTSPVTGALRDCPTGVQTNCLQINWPGMQTNASHAWSGEQPEIRVWYGGLVDGMRDASGQMYMRNRYYDPATGQFTQTDPIGIAGGMNVYGFAAGDSVTYSDPYGLDAIKIVFPDYRISTPLGRRALGHAAVISVDRNGVTRYYEYGRYPDANGRPSNRGFVRRGEVPNVVMGRDGRPTQESLENLYSYVSRHYGQGGRVDADYHADAGAVNAFAEHRMNDPNRDDYGLILNNCYDFANDAVRAGRRATREQQRAKQKEDEKD